MIIPWFLHLTAQFSLFLKFCLEKNKGHLAVAYYNLNAIVPFIKAPHPINNLIKITDPTQAITLNVFALWHLANMFCLVPVSAFTSKGTHTFSRLPMGHRDSFALACNPCRQDLNYSHLPPGAQVSDYTDDVLFQGDSFDVLTFLY